MEEYVPYTSIVDQLDIREAEVLLIASDVTRLAFNSIRREKEFNAGKFLDSFRQRIGNQGTLLVPAYTFNIKDEGSFDIKKSIPITGALSEAALKDPAYCRTGHPLHSFMVSGKYAGEFCKARNKSSFAGDSPFALMHKLEAKMLLIGTTIGEAFTFAHYVEEAVKVKYRKNTDLKINYTDAYGNHEEMTFSIFGKKRGWNMALDKLDDLLEENRLIDRKTINGVPFILVGLDQAYKIISNDIKLNKAKSIAQFEPKLYFKETVKNILRKTGIYRTAADRIADGTHL